MLDSVNRYRIYCFKSNVLRGDFYILSKVTNLFFEGGILICFKTYEKSNIRTISFSSQNKIYCIKTKTTVVLFCVKINYKFLLSSLKFFIKLLCKNITL